MTGHTSWDDLKAEIEARKAEQAERAKRLHWRIAYAAYDAWWSLRRAVYWSKLRYQVRRPKWAWQRARRGWSDRDVWSFDYYMARVLAEGLTHLRDHGHGYPGMPPGETPEVWAAYLTSIIGPLKKYAERDDADEIYTEQDYEEAKAAMHRLAEAFGYMWD